MGTTGAELVWAASVEVPDAVVTRLGALLATEASSDARVGWAPARAAELQAVLAPVARLAPPHGGPSYVVLGSVAAVGEVNLCRSTDPRAGDVLPLVPAADRDLAVPWVVALRHGEVAAVCETARSTPRAVEAGVWTYAPHRRRGLAVAVVAAWTTMVTDRSAFYSTAWDNPGSQAVARRLALRPLGHWWQLSAG